MDPPGRLPYPGQHFEERQQRSRLTRARWTLRSDTSLELRCISEKTSAKWKQCVTPRIPPLYCQWHIGVRGHQDWSHGVGPRGRLRYFGQVFKKRQQRQCLARPWWALLSNVQSQARDTCRIRFQGLQCQVSSIGSIALGCPAACPILNSTSESAARLAGPYAAHQFCTARRLVALWLIVKTQLCWPAPGQVLWHWAARAPALTYTVLPAVPLASAFACYRRAQSSKTAPQAMCSFEDRCQGHLL